MEKYDDTPLSPGCSITHGEIQRMFEKVQEIEQKRKTYEEIGIELGKKMSMYDAWERRIRIEILVPVFNLTKEEILEVIEEMKGVRHKIGENTFKRLLKI